MTLAKVLIKFQRVWSAGLMVRSMGSEVIVQSRPIYDHARTLWTQERCSHTCSSVTKLV